MDITKDFLASLNPSLPDRLPKGAIEQLAQKHGLHEKSVGQMLRGRFGSDEKVAILFQSAIEMMQGNIDAIEQERENWLGGQRVVASSSNQ